jgi:flagellar assembly protein FliH
MLIKKNIFQDIKSKQPAEEPHEKAEHESTFTERMEGKALFNKDAVLAEAYHEAEQILTKARQEAEHLLNTAQSQLDTQIEQLVGERMGHLNELEQKALQELDALSNVRKEVANESKPWLIEVATELASKLINKKVKEDQSILQIMLQETVDQMLASNDDLNKISLVVNPYDTAIAERYAESLKQKSSAGLEITVRQDETVAEGSCLIENPSGMLDLNFSSQLELFKEKVLGANT